MKQTSGPENRAVAAVLNMVKIACVKPLRG
jgi:hypothetical protein